MITYLFFFVLSSEILVRVCLTAFEKLAFPSTVSVGFPYVMSGNSAFLPQNLSLAGLGVLFKFSEGSISIIDIISLTFKSFSAKILSLMNASRTKSTNYVFVSTPGNVSTVPTILLNFPDIVLVFSMINT